MFPTDVVIVAGARTPMARYNGVFSEVSAIDLAAHASREAIRRAGVDPSEFDHATIAAAAIARLLHLCQVHGQ